MKIYSFVLLQAISCSWKADLRLRYDADSVTVHWETFLIQLIEPGQVPVDSVSQLVSKVHCSVMDHWLNTGLCVSLSVVLNTGCTTGISLDGGSHTMWRHLQYVFSKGQRTTRISIMKLVLSLGSLQSSLTGHFTHLNCMRCWKGKEQHRCFYFLFPLHCTLDNKKPLRVTPVYFCILWFKTHINPIHHHSDYISTHTGKTKVWSFQCHVPYLLYFLQHTCTLYAHKVLWILNVHAPSLLFMSGEWFIRFLLSNVSAVSKVTVYVCMSYEMSFLSPVILTGILKPVLPTLLRRGCWMTNSSSAWPLESFWIH